MKTCNKCKETKSVEEFRFADKAKKYRRNICKPCSNEKSRETQKKYRQTDKYNEHHKEYAKKHRKKYNKSEKAKETRKEYRHSEYGRGLMRATLAKYRVAKLQRTPKWADFEVIKKFYIDRPQGMEIDHIYPLQSNWVCGLHTIENLQYLNSSENKSKSNKRIEKYHN